MPQLPTDSTSPSTPGAEDDAAYFAWLASRHRRDRSCWPRWWLWVGVLGALLVHLLFLILVILAPVYLPDQPPSDRGEVLHVLLLPKAAPPAAGSSGGGALPRQAGPPREAHKAGHAPRRPASFRPALAPHTAPPPRPAPRNHPNYAARVHLNRTRAPLPAIKARLPLATQAPRQSVQVSPPAVVIAPPKWSAPRPPRAEGIRAMPPPVPLPPLTTPAAPLPTVSLDAAGVHATARAPVQAVQIATVAGGAASATSKPAPPAPPVVVELPPVRLPPSAPAMPAVTLPKIQPELAKTPPAETPLPSVPARPPTAAAETAPTGPELKHTPPAAEVSAPSIAVSAPPQTPAPAPSSAAVEVPPAPAAAPSSAADDHLGDGSKVDQVSSGHLTMRQGRDDAHGGHLGGPGSGAHLFKKDGSIDLPAASGGTGQLGGAGNSPDRHDISGLNGHTDRRQSGSRGHYIERRATDQENVMGRRSAHIGYTATRFDKDWTPLNESSVDTVARHTAEKVQTTRQALLPSGVRLNCQGGVGAANPDLAKRSGLSLLSIGCREGKPASASRKDGDRRLDLAPAKLLAPSASATPPPSLPDNAFNNSAACATARVAGGPPPPGCPPLHKAYVPAPASSGSWAPPLGQ